MASDVLAFLLDMTLTRQEALRLPAIPRTSVQSSLVLHGYFRVTKVATFFQYTTFGDWRRRFPPSVCSGKDCSWLHELRATTNRRASEPTDARKLSSASNETTEWHHSSSDMSQHTCPLRQPKKSVSSLRLTQSRSNGSRESTPQHGYHLKLCSLSDRQVA